MNSRQVLFGILLVLVVAVGYGVVRFSAAPSESTIENTANGTPATMVQASTTTNVVATGTASTTTKGTVVQPSNLTDGQRKMLSVMGIDPNHIVLTPAMIACANTSLGSARIKELEGGATPSFTEGIKLAACYK